MQNTHILTAALLLLCCLDIQAQPLDRKSFNKGWSVVHDTDRDRMISLYENGLDGDAPTVDLPHDWGVEDSFHQEYPGATGKLGWWGHARYWKDFSLTREDLAGKRFLFSIDGAMSRPKVFCNGIEVGEWGYGYSSFSLDITAYLQEGGNRLMIELDNRNGSSRWYPGGGIFRNVWLTRSDPVGIADRGTRVKVSVGTAAATIDLDVRLRNNSDGIPSGVLRSEVFILGEDGSADSLTTVSTEVDEVLEGSVISQRIQVRSPKLWSPDSPQLYMVRSTLEAEGCSDSYDTVIGIRTAEFTSEGFFLNGVRTPLRGVCLHHDAGALGAAWNTGAWERRLNMLKQMGCNAIRTTHNPPAPELLDLCDRMGFLVIDELTDNWTVPKTPEGYTTLFAEWAERDLVSLIRRDRNHPCVIMWSTGNEVGEQGYPDKWEISDFLTGICHREDPSRPVTAGCDNPWAAFQGWAGTVDVYGFNYKPHLYEQFRQEHPDPPYYGSETASTISSRSVYVFPVSEDKSEGLSDFQMSSYDLYAPYWATTPDTEFKAQDSCPGVAGEFVWTGFDYLGEPTPYNDDITILPNFHDPAQRAKAEEELKAKGSISVPSRSSYFGIIDLAGFPKDRYWLYQSRWRPDLPVAHLLPHWNWEGREGGVTPVMAYTSGDSAELFVNGKSQGLKTRQEGEYRLRWDEVVYEPGCIELVAYKDGKVWAKDKVVTTGKASKLMIAAELGQGPGAEFGGDSQVRNSGRRLRVEASDYSPERTEPNYLFLDIKVADRRGNMVPTACNLLKVKVSGPAKLIAMDAGDPTSHRAFGSDSLEAFNGLCSAIILPDGRKGRIVVTVESEGLRKARQIIRVR